ncbi:MAG: DHHA1 domain-containing protein [Nanoarchaeota archaeon]
MEKREDSLNLKIKSLTNEFKEQIKKQKEILIVSHFDTDGITSATIMLQTLRKLDKTFSVKIVKSLEKETINNLPKDKLIIFLDLGSGNIHDIIENNLDFFIIDHHEIDSIDSEKINILNPELHEKQKISASGLTYLFCKELIKNTEEFSKLSVLGMIGDLLEKEIGKLNHKILKDSQVKKKTGLMIYPSTKPINRTLEFCHNPFLSGITGDSQGVLQFLRETGIKPENGKYKSLIELSKQEMEKLVTGIALRNPNIKDKDLIGDIFLIKFFNKLEDARELSAKINACSRMGETTKAILFCLENKKYKKEINSIYAKYKQEIVSALKLVEKIKIQGQGYLIINAKDKIKDTIIGTIATILAKSSLYPDGTIIISMAYSEKNKIKISARGVGENYRNVRELLKGIIKITNGETGGHNVAAGAYIPLEKEQEFIELIKKNIEIEVVPIVKKQKEKSSQ